MFIVPAAGYSTYNSSFVWNWNKEKNGARVCVRPVKTLTTTDVYKESHNDRYEYLFFYYFFFLYKYFRMQYLCVPKFHKPLRIINLKEKLAQFNPTLFFFYFYWIYIYFLWNPLLDSHGHGLHRKTSLPCNRSKLI